MLDKYTQSVIKYPYNRFTHFGGNLERREGIPMTTNHKNYVNTNNINNLPNTVHHVDPAAMIDKFQYTPGTKTTCNAAIATPNNSTTIIAKVTCKRCLAKLGKLPVVPVSTPKLPAFDESLEANTPDIGDANYTETQLKHVAGLVKSGVVAAPKIITKKTKQQNVHLFYERGPEDVQKNGRPRPNTLCSISGTTTVHAESVTCKVCLSVMTKHPPKTHGESK